jgi:hypothetical protein
VKSGTPIAFDTDPSDVAIRVIDRIERHRYALYCSERPTPEPVDADRFLFPVDAGVAVSTDELRLPTVVDPNVPPVRWRDRRGDRSALESLEARCDDLVHG